LLRKKELDWFYEGGAAAIFPDGLYVFCFMFYKPKKPSLNIAIPSISSMFHNGTGLLATYINYVKSVSAIIVEFK